MPTESKYESQKVNLNRLSKLSRWILLHTGDGIERGQIVEGFYKLERRYCNWYTDPCFTPKEKRDYERRYHRAQPVVTRTLKRLEQLGLVQLLRQACYVKKVRLTGEGKALAQKLNNERGTNTNVK